MFKYILDEIRDVWEMRGILNYRETTNFVSDRLCRTAFDLAHTHSVARNEILSLVAINPMGMPPPNDPFVQQNGGRGSERINFLVKRHFFTKLLPIKNSPVEDTFKEGALG